MERAQQRFEQWMAALAGTEYAAQLAQLQDIDESFYKFLEFGTAGMRGTLGLGTNRMNVFTVRRCTQGLADYILAGGGDPARGVAIAYDSRRMSGVFAKEAALVFAKNGIKVFLYDSLHSVPQLSFALLELGCSHGVVITASHNPPEYNGYKVYGSDGGQVCPEEAANITRAIDAVEDYLQIQPMEEARAAQSGLLEYIGEQMDEEYYRRVRGVSICPEIVAQQNLKVVYTPLFGTGNKPVVRLLQDLGVRELHVVEEQRNPNGDFPGLKAPNPEEKDAYTLAIALADRVAADLIIATDPDCDRMGLCVRNDRGEFVTLTGNQIGCLLLEYILYARRGAIKPDAFAVKSIVSTQLADAIAAHYGVQMRAVPTGFRFVAEQIALAERTGKGSFIFGFEESYGYLAGTFVRDKDAAMAAMLVAEAASSLAAEGKTVWQAVQALYETYGYYYEQVISLSLVGMEGIARIQSAVASLRSQPPLEVGGMRVREMMDCKTGERICMKTGERAPYDFPHVDMLIFELDGGRLILRPSGTEPKLKGYVFVREESQLAAEQALARLAEAARALMDARTAGIG